MLLVPDVQGGGSFYEMASRFPDSTLWASLSRMFTHAEWGGATVWDLIMPAFVFATGAAIPYSNAARIQRGDSEARIAADSLLRALALILLGIYLPLPITSVLDAWWPFGILALGLPVPRLVAQSLGLRSEKVRSLVALAWSLGIISASVTRIVLDPGRAAHVGFGNILTQIGLAYSFAFLIVQRGRTATACVAGAILILYWAAFVVYPLPTAGFAHASVGVTDQEELFEGFFAHWNKGTNAAAAFDSWFLNLVPGVAPQVFNPHGYQTLNFVPTIASMLLGAVAGGYVRDDQPSTGRRNGLLTAGVAGILAGTLSGWLICPIVKSIWTPSWVLFSSGCIVVVFALFYEALDVRKKGAWAFPFVVAGQNTLILYVLALNYRWWVLAPWRHSLQPFVSTLEWEPVLSSAVCALVLWMVAYLLYKLGVHVRL